MSDLSHLLGKVYRSTDATADVPAEAPVDETWAPEQVEQLAAQEVEEERPPTFEEEWAELQADGLVADEPAAAWDDEAALDQAFADWVPGPGATAHAAERELFDDVDGNAAAPAEGWAAHDLAGTMATGWSTDEAPADGDADWSYDDEVVWADDDATAAWTDDEVAGGWADEAAAADAVALTTIDWAEDDGADGAVRAWFDDDEQGHVDPSRQWFDEGDGADVATTVDWVDDEAAAAWFDDTTAAPETADEARADDEGWSFGDAELATEPVAVAVEALDPWRRGDDDVLPPVRRRFRLRRR